MYSGSISFSGQACNVNGTTPCSFDYVVNFTTPFLYNPTSGRLLMDFFVSGFNDNQQGAFDAVDFRQPAEPVRFGRGHHWLCQQPDGRLLSKR